MHRLEYKIQALINRVTTDLDIKIQSDMSKYICVIVCSYIGRYLHDLIITYSKNVSNSKVANFITRHYKKNNNYNYQKIIEELNKYDSSYGEKLKKRYGDDDGKHGSSINSIYNNRNNIAHGKDSQMTMRSIKEYYKNAKDVMEHIANSILNIT